eukprot:753605-Hanusia_phi.AAC.7
MHDVRRAQGNGCSTGGGQSREDEKKAYCIGSQCVIIPGVKVLKHVGLRNELLEGEHLHPGALVQGCLLVVGAYNELRKACRSELAVPMTITAATNMTAHAPAMTAAYFFQLVEEAGRTASTSPKVLYTATISCEQIHHQIPSLHLAMFLGSHAPRSTTKQTEISPCFPYIPLMQSKG